MRGGSCNDARSWRESPGNHSVAEGRSSEIFWLKLRARPVPIGNRANKQWTNLLLPSAILAKHLQVLNILLLLARPRASFSVLVVYRIIVSVFYLEPLQACNCCLLESGASYEAQSLLDTRVLIESTLPLPLFTANLKKCLRSTSDTIRNSKVVALQNGCQSK